MNIKTTIFTSILIYLTNMTLFETKPLPYMISITVIFGLCAFIYFGFKNQTKIKSCDLESLIADIMDSYKTNRNTKPNPKLCGECRKDKTEGYTHCYECRTCVLNRDHHCIWLDTCINKNNWKYFNGMVFLQTLLCFNGLFRSMNFILKDKNWLLECWYLCVFGFNLLVGLFMCFILGNSFISFLVQLNKQEHVSKRSELSELEKKVGHGFSRVTVI